MSYSSRIALARVTVIAVLVGAISLIAGIPVARADVQDQLERLRQAIGEYTVVCGEVRVWFDDQGTLRFSGLPDGVFSMFEARGNDLYFAGRLCTGVMKCPKTAERQC